MPSLTTYAMCKNAHTIAKILVPTLRASVGQLDSKDHFVGPPGSMWSSAPETDESDAIMEHQMRMYEGQIEECELANPVPYWDGGCNEELGVHIHSCVSGMLPATYETPSMPAQVTVGS